MFDVLTMAAVADELTARIMDGRVQRVGMLSRQAVALEIYAEHRRQFLVANAENDDPRVLLLEREPSFDSQLVTPLLLLLRKYVRGGIVVGIEQPPLERIIRVSIAKRLGPHNPHAEDPDADDGPRIEEEDEPDGLEGATFVHLVCEVMGRHSNILLVGDDGRILESVKRVTTKMSRVRPIMPRLPYTAPPVGDRIDSRRLSTAELSLLLANESPGHDIASVLPRRLRGISPQMAREIVFRATGRTKATIDETVAGVAVLARETRRLLEPLMTSSWAPVVYRDSDGESVAYAAVPMEHLVELYAAEPLDSISRAVWLASGNDDLETPGKHAQRRLRLQLAIREGAERLRTRLSSLQEQLAKSEQAEELRSWGEFIYAYLWSIAPGQRELDVEGVRVPLDPALSPSENAQRYFDHYRKAKSAGEHLPELIATVRHELDYLEQLDLLAEQADAFAEFEDVTMEWESYRQAKAGSKSTGKRRPRSTPPRRSKALATINGNAIYLGRSSTENDRITFDLAGPNDTWLHARGVPGSHVIVRWGNPSGAEDDATLDVAASLAAYYSGNRASSPVEVDITRRRSVRKIKGAGPGMVTYRNERTVAVKPRNLEPAKSRSS